MKRGDFIVQKRLEKGYSVAELAKLLNVPETMVVNWENGEIPDSNYLLALAKVLDVDVENLLTAEIEDKPKESEWEEKLRDSYDFDKPVAEVSSTEKLKMACNEEGLCRNGYTRIERIIGYIIFLIFITYMIFSLVTVNTGVTKGKDTELTLENWRRYIDVEIEPLNDTQLDIYVLTLTGKENISNFEIVVATEFLGIFDEKNYDREVVLSGFLTINQELKRELEFSVYVMNLSYKVSYIKGGLV